MNVLITGTSSGIGYGLAKELIQQGHQVWGISRRPTEELFQHERYRHLQLDLINYDEVRRQIPEFLTDVHRMDLVILNAGVLGEVKWMSEVDLDEMKRVMEINTWANKVLLDLLFQEMETIGQVAGMSTKASLRSSPGWGPYSVSKAGLNMLLNVYSKEYPETHFTAFAPGLVDSEIQEHIYQIQETDKYPTIKKLQEARFTEAMPDPKDAAPKLLRGMKKALQYDSGSFVDVRDMDLDEVQGE